MSVSSLWAATADPAPNYPALADAGRADVAIIGGGFTGLSAALHIARDGRQAAVLEAETIGWGASGRNGGLVSGKFRVPFHVVDRMHGREAARLLHRLGKEAVETVGELTREHDIASARFTMCGYVIAAHTARALATQHRTAEWLAGALGDTSSRVLDRAEVAAETGSPGYVGGVLNGAAGSIHPLNYVRGLARAASATGAAIHENSPAIDVARDGSGFRIATPHGELRVRQLIVATNAYSARHAISAGLHRRIVPFRSAIIATAPLPAEVRARILPNARVAADTRRLLRWYRMVEGRLIFGGRGAFGQDDSASAFARLQRDMVATFPPLAAAAIDYRWSGLVAMTMDQVPHVGRLDDNVFFAAGYNGTGVALSSLMGRKLAALTRGETPQLGLLGRPLAPIPLRGLTTPAVRMITGWYQILDGLGR